MAASPTERPPALGQTCVGWLGTRCLRRLELGAKKPKKRTKLTRGGRRGDGGIRGARGGACFPCLSPPSHPRPSPPPAGLDFCHQVPHPLGPAPPKDLRNGHLDVRQVRWPSSRRRVRLLILRRQGDSRAPSPPCTATTSRSFQSVEFACGQVARRKRVPAVRPCPSGIE